MVQNQASSADAKGEVSLADGSNAETISAISSCVIHMINNLEQNIIGCNPVKVKILLAMAKIPRTLRQRILASG